MIKLITYNWSFTHEKGENFYQAEVGINGVILITEHRAQGEGDKWYYEVSYADGVTERIFNPNLVVYVKK